MPEASHPDHLIRAGRLQADDARLFTPEADGPADQTPPDEPGWLVTLATWKAAAATLRARRHPVGVQLPPDARLDELTGPDGELDRAALSFIAIEFPVYTDGRGYSLAQLLRRRYGWDGELRAVGDVMIDTIHYQARVGFDSFLVKPGHDPQRALAAFRTFSVHYQHTYPAPLAA